MFYSPLRWCCVAAAGMLVSLCCGAQEKPLDLSVILNGLEHHPPIQSAYVEFTHVQTLTETAYQQDSSIQRLANPPVRTEKMVSAFQGEKQFRRTFPLQEPQTGSQKIMYFVETAIYDGKQSWHMESSAGRPNYYPRSQVDSRNIVMADTPLNQAYFDGKEWMYDYLKRKKCAFEGTVEDKKFGTLAIVRCQEGGISIRFWFAPKYGFMVVRSESVNSKAGRRDVWSVTQVAQQEGIWLPVEERSESFETSHGYDQRISGNLWKDAHYQINHVPEGLFTANLPTGSRLWDPQKQIMYEIEEGGKRVVQGNQASQQDAIVAQVPLFVILGLAATGLWLWSRRSKLAGRPEISS